MARERHQRRPVAPEEARLADLVVLARDAEGENITRAAIETVIFRPVPEGSTRMAMLEAGEADIVQTFHQHALALGIDVEGEAAAVLQADL
mgnify:CR=1 FL=1